jgi:FMN-dependent NADH-azoreductase
MSRRPARVPHLDHDALSANFTPAEARTPSQREARALVERLVGELLEADDNVLRLYT